MMCEFIDNIKCNLKISNISIFIYILLKVDYKEARYVKQGPEARSIISFDAFIT